MKFYLQSWWKYLAVILVLYSIIGGLLISAPRLPILNETIRCLYYHVPMWFAMMALMLGSLIMSIKFLWNGDMMADLFAEWYAKVSIVLGILGLVTGMMWATFTWGSPWHGDPKQNASAIALLIYLAYSLLRNSLPEQEKRARIAAVYNVFAFFAMLALIWIVPRMTDSLHPGNGGNPGFSPYDLDAYMRMVFYPANIGWILIGFWISSLFVRLKLIDDPETYNKYEKVN